MLGINNYGNRTIAKSRDDKKLMSKNFLEIYLIQFSVSSIMLVCYVIYVLFFAQKEYVNLFLIQSLFILSNMFNINWFFWGLEKFKLTVTRNTILKLASLIGIFIFVKDSSDIAIYAFILSGVSLLSEMILWLYLRKEIIFEKSIKLDDLKVHFKQCVVLFIPVVAVSLYKVMDKIMLGGMISIHEVGLYEQAEKIINVPISIITALGTVMLPKISNLVQNSEEKRIKAYINKSIEFMMFLAMPMCFGLIAVSKEFVPMFLGNEFYASIILVNLLAITVIFIAFANVIRTQYLIPKEKDKIYITSVIMGAIINFVFNLILMKKYKAIGACYSTILAEFFVMFYQVVKVRKELPIWSYIKVSIKYLIKSIIMFALVLVMRECLIIDDRSTKVIYMIIFGGIVYGLLNIKYMWNILNVDDIIKKIKKEEAK